jgi:phosphocarrier protein HPr
MNKPVTVQVINMRGLHARASAKIVKCAENYDAQVSLVCDGKSADALSMMELLMLGAHKDCQVFLDGTGAEAEEAITAIVQLINDRFGEER